MFWTKLKMDFSKSGIMNYHDINRLDLFEFLRIFDNWNKENKNGR
jgi:hypothetical protein